MLAADLAIAAWAVAGIAAYGAAVIGMTRFLSLTATREERP